MAVPVQTPYIEYTANGATTSFALGFDCEDQGYLIITVNEAEPSVGSWSLVNGNVVFNSAPVNGAKIIIKRNTPYQRSNDYQTYDQSFRPPAVNLDFDRIWRKLQELGVMDWLLGNRIDDLKNYVDDRDDELRAYLLEEIRKQGVALDQLEDYYNYLMQRLAEIAVNQGWDASFVVDGNENQHEINRTTVRSVNTIADLMSLQNPKNDQVVSVKGYYAPTNFALAQPYKGGGQRVYVESRKTENDGFLCINGWVLTGYGNELDTYQAGFADGDLTDHSSKFQSMLNSLPNGTHLKVYGEHRVSTTMLVLDKNNITVEFVDDAVLSAKELRDSFIFKGYDGSPNGSGARGILHFHQCNNPKVIKPIIRGCQKHNLNSPEPWEDGDAGVGFSICANPLVEHGDISHTTTWGIIAERSTNAVAQYNHVYNVLRQSGISITINEGTGGKAFYNTIHDVGLYGLEWETYADSFGNQSFGNIAYNCLKGEAVVGNVCEITSSLNTYTNCYQGINSENTNVANSKLITYSGNTIINGWIGDVFASAGRVTAQGNIFKMQNPPSYYILTAYDTVLQVLNDTQFTALGRSSVVVGDNIKINNVVYNVTNVTTAADTIYGSGTLKTVTVDNSLAGVRDMTQFFGMPKDVNSAFYTAGSSSIVNIYGNTAEDYAVGFKSDTVDTSNAENQVVRRNSFKNVTKLLELNTDNRVLRFYENTLDGTYFDSSGLLPSLAQYIFPKTKKIQVYHSTTLGKTLSFHLPETTAVIAVEILFPTANGSTTGVTVVELDGSQNIATIASGSLNNTINTVKMYNVMSAGVHTLKILDTVGNLAYGEVIISIIAPV